MKKKRNIIIIVGSVFAVLLLIMVLWLGNTDFIGSAVITDYDETSNTGHLTAFANNQIYYYSNEADGVNGIYKMDLDGSNVELLIECPDIKRLTIYDEKIYYVGLSKHFNPYKHYPTTYYGMYESSDFETSQRIEPNLECVRDAFFFENGFIAATEIYTNKWSFEGRTYLIQDGQIIEPNDSDILINKAEISDGNLSVFQSKQIEEVDIKFYITSGFPKSDEVNAYFLYGTDAFGTLKDGRIIPYSLSSNSNMRYLVESNEMVVGIGNAIYVFNLEDYTLKDKIEYDFVNSSIDKDDRYYNNVYTNMYFSKDEIIYAKVDSYKENRSYVSSHLITIDLDNSNIIVVDEISRNTNILSFNDEKVVSYKSGKIYINTHDGSKITSSQQIASIGRKDIVVERVSNWIFLYEEQETNTQHTLLYKINVQTGEVIENIVPFDSTQHDEIHIDEDAPEYE